MGFVGSLLEDDKRDAEDTGENADGRKRDREIQQGGDHVFIEVEPVFHTVIEHVCDKNDRRGNRAYIAFQQVGPQSGNVADVVADVIRDGGGIAGVILGNMGFGLADQISTHIGRFGIDTAADPVEQRDHRTAERIPRDGHGEGDKGNPERILIDHEILGIELTHRLPEHQIDRGHAQQRKTRDRQAHDRPALERDFQCTPDRFGHARLVGDPHVGDRRDLHADVAGRRAHDCTGQEGDADIPGDHQAEQDRNAGRRDRDDPVFVFDERPGAIRDDVGQFPHAVGAATAAFDRQIVIRSERQ